MTPVAGTILVRSSCTFLEIITRQFAPCRRWTSHCHPKKPLVDCMCRKCAVVLQKEIWPSRDTPEVHASSLCSKAQCPASDK